MLMIKNLDHYHLRSRIQDPGVFWLCLSFTLMIGTPYGSWVEPAASGLPVPLFTGSKRKRELNNSLTKSESFILKSFHETSSPLSVAQIGSHAYS